MIINKIPIFLLSFLILLCIHFPSCKHKSINAEYGNLSLGLIDSLRPISAETQNFKIDPTIDNTIVGKEGTIVYISANSLSDEKGDTITSATIIHLREFYNITDFVTGHLQTVHNNQILQSKGMIYLQASNVTDRQINVIRSKPVRIEMPSSSTFTNVKFFKGIRDDNGDINWVTVEEQSKTLIPFPIKIVAGKGYFECQKDFAITKNPEIWKKDFAKVYYTYDDLTKYENTLIATREFRDRYYSYCMPELTKIYLSNLDKNLWELDELAVQYFIKDSTERVNFEINNKPSGINGGPRTKDQDTAHDWLVNQQKEYSNRIISTFRTFASQKLTKVDPTKKLDITKIKDFDRAFTAYDANEFGWINCDFFYNDPKAQNVKLSVRIDNGLPSIINLIFKNKKIALDGHDEGDNLYKFTLDKPGYTKLPKGDTATILAIGYTDNKITFASKDIIIGENEIEKINLNTITASELKSKLMSLTK